MNPVRLLLGVMLLSLCVFGLPEGCLVLASSAADPGPRLAGDNEPAALLPVFPATERPSPG